ncbi:hypothetical protein GGR74_003290 [Xanthomonas arboricola]
MKVAERFLRLAVGECALSSKQRPQEQALKPARHEKEEAGRK